MRRYDRLQLIAFVGLFSLAAFAGTAFQATTTLTAETSNNTSAADTFVTQTDGNIGAGNVSKVPTRSLLYSGSTSNIYAHLMLWFGTTGHMNVGYASADTTQIHKQATDMISRGIQGAIIDWYGQGTTSSSFATINQATQYFMNEAELHPNFFFAVMDDATSLKSCAATAGCDVTQTLINDLTYAYNNFENSSAYLRFNSQPVVYFFGQETYTTIDWNQVRASVPGNPLFIFRNTGGFTYAQSNGAFSWIAPETATSTDTMALNYLDNFDSTAISNLPAYSTESGYKGFNDTLAAWGSGRIINQFCGQTWLTSIAQSAKYYSASKQMLGFQLVTWNDYEEGTEIESGIDNCVTVSASVSGTVASWSITGQSSTIDHYTVFVSQDGENLMWLADVPSTTTSLNLAQFNLNSGTYTVFIKAVGQPSMTNKMSAGVSLTVPNQPQGFGFVPNGSTSATISAGQTATYNMTLNTNNSGFTGVVSLNCGGAPSGVACSVSPSSATFTASTVSVPLTVTVTASQQAHLAPVRLWAGPFTFAAVFVGLLLGGKKQARHRTLAAISLFLIYGLIACGGSGTGSSASSRSVAPPSPTSSTITITGTSGSQSASASLTLTVTH